MTRGRRRSTAALALGLILLGSSLSPAYADATFTVTSIDDEDDAACTVEHCSLREALLAANAEAGTDVVDFALPGDPPYVIAPAAALPAVTEAVSIDATTQPGYAGDPVITLDGTLAGTTDGLVLSGAGITVAGLAVVRFALNGVRIPGSGNTVRASAIGTDGTGAPDLGNGSVGVLLLGPGNTVGGPGAEDGNAIVGNGGAGVRVGNVATGNLVEGNRIEANGAVGVLVATGGSSAIRANSILGNAALGIDLAPAGVTLNDPGDADTGANGRQNSPVIASASHETDTAITTVSGSLPSTPSSSFTVELFANAACDPSGSGEGETPLATTVVLTEANGDGVFSFEVPDSGLPVGAFATATATSAAGDTSELSACRVVEASDPPEKLVNFVVILTDDQSRDTVPHTPAVMPYLQGRVQDPDDSWVQFSSTYTNVAMCCPARATLLTGRYAHHTGVQSNEQGELLDETDTLATWLDAAGYRTGLVGKYLNGYPFQRGHYVPPGWDSWVGWEGPNNAQYYEYTLNEDGIPVSYGTGAANYSTDVYKAKALAFLDGVEEDEPFFLYFAPNGPHAPRTPAPRHANLWPSGSPVRSPSFNEADVSDKPAWLRARPRLNNPTVSKLDRWRLEQYRALASVDQAIQALVQRVTAMGELDRTVFLFIPDNGVSFGEHRWDSKLCPYRSCSQIPMFARIPWVEHRNDGHVLSNADIAPTIAELAGAVPGGPVDGRSFVSLLDGSPVTWTDEALLQWVGPQEIPGYWGIRTRHYTYLEYPASREIELYDLTGQLGAADPDETRNVCPGNRPPCAGAYEAVRAHLAARLDELRDG